MFKIVQTRERGKPRLSIVPTNWERNGLLYWPQTNLYNLQRNPESRPESSWFQYSCEVKRALLSFEEAEFELNEMLENSDTDRDDHQISVRPTIVTQQRKKARVMLPRKPNNLDFNDLAKSCVVSSVDAMASVQQKSLGKVTYRNSVTEKSNVGPIKSCTPTVSDTLSQDLTNRYNGLSDDEAQLPVVQVYQNYEVLHSQVEHSNADVVQDIIGNSPHVIPDGGTSLDEIKTILCTVLENQDQLCKEFATLSVTVETALKKVRVANTTCDTCAHRGKESTEGIVGFSQIGDLEQLKNLESMLSNKQQFIEYFDKLKIICGSNTTTKGINHCYVLVDKFFTRKFFTLCSWAGGSKGDIAKFPFKIYENVICLFFKLVNLADPKFSFEECQDFFKNVIRNSQRRSNSLNVRTSKTKNRPKQAVFKKFPDPDTVMTSSETQSNETDELEGNSVDLAVEHQTDYTSYKEDD